MSNIVITVLTVSSLVLGWIYIPAIKLARPIVIAPIVDQNFDMSRAGYSIAYLETTNWIDDPLGRVGLGGHNPGVVDSDGIYHSGSFDEIEYLKAGDEIIIVDNQYKARYLVYAVRIVTINQTKILAPTNDPTLVLITCWGDQRLIIEAIRIDLKELNQ